MEKETKKETTIKRTIRRLESFYNKRQKLLKEKRGRSIPGICNIEIKLSAEEQEKRIKESYERQFSPHFKTGGRFGNISIPFEEGIF